MIINELVYLDMVLIPFNLVGIDAWYGPLLDLVLVGIVPTLRTFEWTGMLYVHMDYMTRDDIVSAAYLSGWYNVPYRLEALFDVGDNDKRLELNYVNFIVSDDLDEDKVIVSEGFRWMTQWIFQEADPLFDFEENPEYLVNQSFTMYGTSTFSEKSADLTIEDILFFDTDMDLIQQYVGDEQNEYEDFIVMNPTTYYSLFDNAVYQPSVYVTSLFDAKLVVEDIEELGFNAIYPQTIEDPFTALLQIILTVVFGGLMMILLVIMYFITYLVLRNIQAAKKKDFLIFRSIGASKASLNRVTIFELLTLTMVSVAIVFSLLKLNSMFYWIRQIATIMSLFTVGNYIFLFFLHL